MTVKTYQVAAGGGSTPVVSKRTPAVRHGDDDGVKVATFRGLRLKEINLAVSRERFHLGQFCVVQVRRKDEWREYRNLKSSACLSRSCVRVFRATLVNHKAWPICGYTQQPNRPGTIYQKPPAGNGPDTRAGRPPNTTLKPKFYNFTCQKNTPITTKMIQPCDISW